MTIKLNALSRWTKLPEEGVIFGTKKSPLRRLRVQFNASVPTAINVAVDGAERLLTVIPSGLETVEFNASGEVPIYADTTQEVWYLCAEEEPTCTVFEAPRIFTKIAQRKARNPELEHMMFMMNQNIERRFQQQAADYERQLAAADERAKANVAAGGIHGAAAPEPQKPDAVQNDVALGDDGAKRSASEAPQGDSNVVQAQQPAGK